MSWDGPDDFSFDAEEDILPVMLNYQIIYIFNNLYYCNHVLFLIICVYSNNQFLIRKMCTLTE